MTDEISKGTYDLDLDGDYDFVGVRSIGNQSFQVYFWENDGTGELIASPISELLQRLLLFQIEDINDDGLKDVCISYDSGAEWGSSTLSWFENFGDGTFSSEQFIFEEDDFSRQAFFQDMDGDGSKELLVFRNTTFFDISSTWALYTAENGIYDLITSQGQLSLNEMAAAAPGDVNGDGLLDIIYAEPFLGTVTTLINDGQNGFDFGGFIILDQANNVVIADFNNDDQNDLLFSSSSSVASSLTYCPLNLEDEFVDSADFTEIPILNHSVSDITEVDLNGDGLLDILMHSKEDGLISWIRNLGMGNFALERIIDQGLDGIGEISVLDYDDDGDQDILFQLSSTDVIYLIENMPALPLATFEPIACLNQGFENISTAYYPDTTWEWDFGNGEVSTEVNPTYEILEGGEYEVSLTACNSLGCDTESQTIFVKESSFEAPDFALVGEEVSFIDNSIGFTNWTWVFGNGDSSIEPSPQYVYEEAGVYEVQHIVTNSDEVDCTVNSFHEIVIELPSAMNSDRSFDEISIFPNPSKGVISCLITEWDGLLEYKVLDLQGKLVSKGVIEKPAEEIDLGFLRQGTYEIIFTNGSWIRNETLLISPK